MHVTIFWLKEWSLWKQDLVDDMDHPIGGDNIGSGNI
jgi:hypothetical protein